MPACSACMLSFTAASARLSFSSPVAFFAAVRGSGVAHGTLPTSSTDWHCANHPGVGSALVSKRELVEEVAELTHLKDAVEEEQDTQKFEKKIKNLAKNTIQRIKKKLLTN